MWRLYGELLVLMLLAFGAGSLLAASVVALLFRPRRPEADGLPPTGAPELGGRP